jgi:hypothetical protein
MDFLSALALVLLTLVGYSAGAVIGAKKRLLSPELIDLGVVVVLWILALSSRSVLGKWVAIAAWLVLGGLVSYVLSIVRLRNTPVKTGGAGTGKREGNLLKQLWENWKGFASEMGNYQGRILLAFFYFLVVTPFGILVRLFSDPLQVKHSDDSWNAYPPTGVGLDDARRQF